MLSSMFRSVVTVLCVSRIMSQLSTIHLRISNGNILEAAAFIEFSLLPNCYSDFMTCCNYLNPYIESLL